MGLELTYVIIDELNLLLVLFLLWQVSVLFDQQEVDFI